MFELHLSTINKDPPKGAEVTSINPKKVKEFLKALPVIGEKLHPVILETIVSGIKTIKIKYELDLAIFHPEGVHYLKVEE